MFAAGLVLKVSRPVGTDPLCLVSDQETENALDTTYIDGDAVVVTVEEADLLMSRAEKAAAIIANVYRRFKFDFNYSPGRVRGVGSLQGQRSQALQDYACHRWFH